MFKKEYDFGICDFIPEMTLFAICSNDREFLSSEVGCQWFILPCEFSFEQITISPSEVRSIPYDSADFAMNGLSVDNDNVRYFGIND